MEMILLITRKRLWSLNISMIQSYFYLGNRTEINSVERLFLPFVKLQSFVKHNPDDLIVSKCTLM